MKEIRHIEKAIDALIVLQDDGYGTEAIANAISSLNNLLSKAHDARKAGA